MSYSEETKRNVAEAYEGGRSTREIARAFGVGHSTVNRWCRQQGAHIRPSGSQPGRPKSTSTARNALGALLQTRRLEQGLTQQELGSLIGSTHSHIAHIESGTRGLSLARANRISAALDIPIQDLADAAERDAQEKEASK